MEQTKSFFFLLPRTVVSGTNWCVQPRRSVSSHRQSLQAQFFPGPSPSSVPIY